MKKWTILTILCLMPVSGIYASLETITDKTNKQLVEELHRLASDDTTRFYIYQRLIDMSDDLKTETYYANKMLTDAEAQEYEKFKCQAYYQQIVLAYNQYDSESVMKWVNLLEPIARKTKNFYYLFNGRRAAIDMLVLNGEYEKEEKEATKMLQDAKKLNYPIGVAMAHICLANIYSMTYRLEEAGEALEKAHKIALAENNDILVYQINNSIINTYQALKDYTKLLKWIRTADNYLQEQLRKNRSTEKELKGWLMLTDVAYVKYYTNIGDLQRADFYVNRAETYEMNKYGTYGRIYHSARYSYFYKADLLEKALIEADALATIFKEISPDSYASMVFLKARTLADLKREDEALECYKRAFQISDSIKIVFLNRQTEQLKKDYDTDSLLLEKEKINKNKQLLLLGVMLLFIIFLICYAIHTYRVRRGLQKSEEEMRKMAKEMEAANVAKEHFLATISSSISIPLNEVVDGSLLLATEEVTDQKERQEISHKLNKMSAELMGLINNILNLSKLEAGMMRFKTSSVELLPFVKGLVTTGSSKGYQIQTAYDEAVEGLKVQVDEGQLAEVFNHLLKSDNEMSIAVQLLENSRYISIRITESELSLSSKQGKETAISNEVNRLVIEFFGGKYQVDLEQQSICFTLPIEV